MAMKSKYAGPITVDSEDDDYTICSSSSTSGYVSDTTTFATTIFDYKYENGRRYHSYREGAYWAPNDTQQNDQLNLFHQVYTLVLQGELYDAPLTKDVKSILDVGTGTGIWAIEMSNKFPCARIVGNDLSPTQPSWVPSNVEFEVDDITQDWTHPPCSFDFIHARALAGSIPCWPTFLSRACRTLSPGGWFESVETTLEQLSDDNSVPPESAVAEWYRLLSESGETVGKTFDTTNISTWMEEQGFVNVSQRVFKIPTAPWPVLPALKEIGKQNLANLLEGMEGFSLALFTRVLEWDTADVDALLARVRSEFLDRKVHSYYRMFVVIGQKPEDAAASEKTAGNPVKFTNEAGPSS
ncbi:uncharacterized protein H6S33_009981 [Morchella sextelata]|uniref:uncharacterized protein n=1 Tax=Morchella sextelata TaxID=1174677 RepID=UPI001D050092|nr:uncharacterized protein H6S33_009981 [Morchella sextelata]KAH0611929.1 hypothetical protein H6S33_009981 [Morchella sextelata]